MIILRYHEVFFRLIAPRCPGMADGAVQLLNAHEFSIIFLLLLFASDFKENDEKY